MRPVLVIIGIARKDFYIAIHQKFSLYAIRINELAPLQNQL